MKRESRTGGLGSSLGPGFRRDERQGLSASGHEKAGWGDPAGFCLERKQMGSAGDVGF